MPAQSGARGRATRRAMSTLHGHSRRRPDQRLAFKTAIDDPQRFRDSKTGVPISGCRRAAGIGHVDRRAGPHLQDKRRRRPSSALRGGHYHAHPLPRVQQLEGLGPEACQEARLQAAHAWRWLGKHFLSAPTRCLNNDPFAAVHESGSGTFATCRRVRNVVPIRGKADVAQTSRFCSE